VYVQCTRTTHHYSCFSRIPIDIIGLILLNINNYFTIIYHYSHDSAPRHFFRRQTPFRQSLDASISSEVQSSMTQQTIYVHRIKSPVGNLNLVADEKSLLALTFAGHHEESAPPFAKAVRIKKESPVIKKAAKQLTEYFAGKRKVFDLDLNPAGTVFQKKAWKALRQIPYGSTLSYKEQASKIGSAKAVRAVGSANGQNPIAIIVPCHRVIASSGKLSGYAGGTKTKAKLLALEGIKAL